VSHSQGRRMLQRIKRSMDQIAEPAELRVDYATQLLSNRARTCGIL
jgi:hypothetical protein